MVLFGRRSSRVVLHKKLVPVGICFGILLSLTAVPFMGCQQRKSPPSAKDGFLSWQQSAPVDDEDFEPVLRLDGHSKTSQANSPEKVALKRPRFYSTELEIREKLLVVVLTSPETVETFGAAVNRTLSGHPNKLIFYACASDGDSSPAVLSAPSVLQLPGTKCDSLAYHVLRHLSVKNTAKDFDFVFLMRDSTYVNGEKLVSIATHVSVNVEVFLGRSTNGACDLDAGMLLSNGVFKKVLGNLDSCLVGTGEILDDHIAQCIAKVSGVPCSDVFQEQPFYSFNLEKDFGYVPDPATLTTRKDFSAVVTLYPVLTSKYFYRLHHHFSLYNLQKVKRQIAFTEKQIADVAIHLPNDTIGRAEWPLGVEPTLKPSNRFDIIRSVYFNDTHLFWKTDTEVTSLISGAEKLSIEDLKTSAKEFLVSSFPKNNLTLLSTVDGYRKFDPTRGLSYVMHLLLWNETSKAETYRTLEFLRPLGKSEIIGMPYVTEHTRIIMVLFVKEKELDHVAVFIEEYAKSCLEKNDNTMLLLAFLQPAGVPDVFGNIRSFAVSSSNRFRKSNAKLATISIRIPEDRRVPSDFALIDLVVRKLPQDSLILLCQAGMEIRTDYLNRVRMNTVSGVQVFLPIPFTQYHPIITEQDPVAPAFLELKRENGFFDSNNFKHFSFYVSDYWRHRALIAKEVPLAHSSTDLTADHYHGLTFGIVELFLVSKQVHLLRAVEPELRVRYIWRDCSDEPNLRAAENCKLSRLYSVGNRGQQAKFLASQTTSAVTGSDVSPSS
ncbi:chondroitin sulfate glucuronyltransferase [Dermacentor andersoni]|uniref:chondroitin sulfate glucuronyltransferase n=1 Tax=Dermacentor andersoni TaxID=34620 RepID=UPI002155B14D|nr:chondroitin sulfate glucuronyltransferase-like [Dermacentor andersoni]